MDDVPEIGSKFLEWPISDSKFTSPRILLDTSKDTSEYFQGYFWILSRIYFWILSRIYFSKDTSGRYSSDYLPEVESILNQLCYKITQRLLNLPRLILPPCGSQCEYLLSEQTSLQSEVHWRGTMADRSWASRSGMRFLRTVWFPVRLSVCHRCSNPSPCVPLKPSAVDGCFHDVQCRTVI